MPIWWNRVEFELYGFGLGRIKFGFLSITSSWVRVGSWIDNSNFNANHYPKWHCKTRWIMKVTWHLKRVGQHKPWSSYFLHPFIYLFFSFTLFLVQREPYSRINESLEPKSTIIYPITCTYKLSTWDVTNITKEHLYNRSIDIWRISFDIHLSSTTLLQCILLTQGKGRLDVHSLTSVIREGNFLLDPWCFM